MMIKTARYVALDTSHLNSLATDKFSDDSALRARAQSFEQRLLESNSVLLLCWHHLEEMLRHGDDSLVENRVAYIRSIPYLAWVRVVDGSSSLGSVVDVMAREAFAAFNAPSSTVNEVRVAAATEMFKFGSGEDLMEPLLEWLPLMVKLFRNGEQHTKAVAAIAHSSPNPVNDLKIVDVLAMRAPSETERETRLRALEAMLSAEIRQRGDSKLRTPEAVASDHVQQAREALRVAYACSADGASVALTILMQQGISEEDISASMTVGEAGDLASFRSHLKVSTDRLGMDWIAVKSRVSREQLPSWQIQHALTRYRQDIPERAGSEIADRYLACLAPYASETYVDKRTLENFNRAKLKVPALSGIVNSIKKKSTYSLIDFSLM